MPVVCAPLVARSSIVINEIISWQVSRVSSTMRPEIAGLSPAALALGKEAFYRALELPYGPALGHLRDLLTIVARSEDAREGIAAFLEKRPPRWQGR